MLSYFICMNSKYYFLPNNKHVMLRNKIFKKCFDSKVSRKCVTHKTKKAIFMYLRKVKTYARSRFY